MEKEKSIKEIRVQLRRFMNGVVSSSMRESGITYKLNFGAALPDIKAIAAKYEKNAELAETLWKEDIREFKILATLLYPASEFTETKAEEWINQVPYQEIAEQLSRNLLQEVPFVSEKIKEWVMAPEEMKVKIAFMVFTRLSFKGIQWDEQTENLILKKAREILEEEEPAFCQVVLAALKRYGMQAPEQAEKVLQTIGDYACSDSSVKEEFYNQLKFEFDYYH